MSPCNDALPRLPPGNVATWVEPTPDGGFELVISMLGVTERRIPFASIELADEARVASAYRYLEDYKRRAQA